VGNCRWKRVGIDLERLRQIPLRNRTTLRCLATSLGVSESWLVLKLKTGELKWHSNYIHPTLTEGNRLGRIEHCLSMIDPATVPTTPTFLQMENAVHIDEKWFNMTRKIQTYYLTPDEEEPVQTAEAPTSFQKLCSWQLSLYPGMTLKEIAHLMVKYVCFHLLMRLRQLGLASIE